jgi:hypothetical protein
VEEKNCDLRSAAKQEKMKGGWRSVAKHRENDRLKTSWMRRGNLEQQTSRSFFSAKRLKKKLGHFLVEKD